MKIVITDTGTWPYRLKSEDMVIQDNGFVQPCRQCNTCWIKTPGMCVIPDNLQYIGATLSRCEEMIIVSRVEYGALSPFVTSVLDRMKPYVYPMVTGVSGSRYKSRYDHHFTISAFLYSENMSEADKQAMRDMQYNLAQQLGAVTGEIVFMHDALSLGVRV